MSNELELRREEVGSIPIPHLIFLLADAQYAIPVTQVREIISAINITRVPGSPDYLEGVTNLRGQILPIVNIRRKFHFDLDAKLTRECFVVLSVDNADLKTEFGIRVDSVIEVAKYREEDIDSAPSMSDLASALVFTGVAKTPQGVRLVLDTSTLARQLKHDIVFAKRLASPQQDQRVPAVL